MRILAFDPGAVCGIALVDGKTDLIFCAASLVELIGDWLTLATAYHIDHIVIESPPQNIKRSDDYWHIVDNEIKKLYPKAPRSYVSPGQWKPFKRVLKRKGDKFANDHEQDATYLARYVLRKLR